VARGWKRLRDGKLLSEKETSGTNTGTVQTAKRGGGAVATLSGRISEGGVDGGVHGKRTMGGVRGTSEPKTEQASCGWGGRRDGDFRGW